MSNDLGQECYFLWKNREIAPFHTFILIYGGDRVFGEAMWKHIFLPETESTNDECKNKGRVGAAEGLVIVADYQTQGRGRLKRSWESPREKNLLFSVLLRPSVTPEEATRLTLVAGVAFQKVLRENFKIPVTIKWPNDLLIEGLKVGGILTEMETKKDQVDFVVLGLGLNVNSLVSDYPQELQSSLTTLCSYVGNEFDRSQLLASLLNSFETYYHDFLNDKWPQILKEYEGVLAIS